MNSGAFDLVLSDVQMPGLSGLDVLKSIRENYSLSELPVIFVTANSESPALVHGEDIETGISLVSGWITPPASRYRFRSGKV